MHRIAAIVMLLETMLENTNTRKHAHTYIQAILGFDKNEEGFLPISVLSLIHPHFQLHTHTRVKESEYYALAQTKRNILQRFAQIVEQCCC